MGLSWGLEKASNYQVKRNVKSTSLWMETERKGPARGISTFIPPTDVQLRQVSVPLQYSNSMTRLLKDGATHFPDESEECKN